MKWAHCENILKQTEIDFHDQLLENVLPQKEDQEEDIDVPILCARWIYTPYQKLKLSQEIIRSDQKRYASQSKINNLLNNDNQQDIRSENNRLLNWRLKREQDGNSSFQNKVSLIGVLSLGIWTNSKLTNFEKQISW